MKRIGFLVIVLSLLWTSICFAENWEYVTAFEKYGTKFYLDTDSIKPTTYKMWDCYRVKLKIAYSKGDYSKEIILINTDNKNWGTLYSAKFTKDNILEHEENRENTLMWTNYLLTPTYKVVIDRVFEIQNAKEGK